MPNTKDSGDDYVYPEEIDPDENSYEEEEYIELPENKTILDVYDAVVDNATITPLDGWRIFQPQIENIQPGLINPGV